MARVSFLWSLDWLQIALTFDLGCILLNGDIEVIHSLRTHQYVSSVNCGKILLSLIVWIQSLEIFRISNYSLSTLVFLALLLDLFTH